MWPKQTAETDTEVVVLSETTESTSATTRQLDKLRCPTKSDLCRKGRPYYAQVWWESYYAQNYAGIMCQGLVRFLVTTWIFILQ